MFKSLFSSKSLALPSAFDVSTAPILTGLGGIVAGLVFAEIGVSAQSLFFAFGTMLLGLTVGDFIDWLRGK